MNTRIYNHKKDAEDSRDYIYKPVISVPEKLPDSIDLRKNMPPIYDQGQLGSCTANAGVGLREFEMISGGLPRIPLSRLYVYYKERELEGTVNIDSGAYLRDLCKVLVKNGCCPEYDFPYDITKFTDKPSTQAEQDAPSFKANEYHRVLTYNELKSALLEKKAVAIGFNVYDSFESFDVSCGGMIPTPDVSKEKMLGGHAVLACGYLTIGNMEYIIIRNSWSTNWGDRGYCYMPRTYWELGLVTDMWTFSVNPYYNQLTIPQSIDILVEKKVIESPDFWTNLYNKYKDGTNKDFQYVGLSMQKMAAYAYFCNYVVKDNTAYNKLTFQQALDILSDKNVIASPEFWVNLCAKYDKDATSDFRYVDLLFRKFATFVNGW